jgi:hypothetical protein
MTAAAVLGDRVVYAGTYTHLPLWVDRQDHVQTVSATGAVLANTTGSAA